MIEQVDGDAAASLEIWGGVEATVNRVGDTYIDQIKLSGHDTRNDMGAFEKLGFKALRFPVLWERTQARAGGPLDWRWSDRRLEFLRVSSMRPIVGLLHHGSGPRFTNLLDPPFPELLAQYAGAVATRYPWIDAYTPINEPLTTARFSALYGHWYPHKRDAASFCRALINQCRGIVLAMRAIRQIHPNAQLIQTEDLGKVHSPESLRYQAEFENHRRWASWDLIGGSFDRRHPMWSYFRDAGIGSQELEWFLSNPMIPDIYGINYYVTSERYLDPDWHLYPSINHGSNGQVQYADVEAVRVLADGFAGIDGILREAWRRYDRPLALTEVHLGCTREEQLRWFWQAWQSAHQVAAEGADVRAITAWSLLGSHDWNSLLTRQDGHYESGVFDVRSRPPRPTALAKLIEQLSAGRGDCRGVISSPGWWQREDRRLLPTWRDADGHCDHAFELSVTPRPFADQRPIVITGGNGTLAIAFEKICHQRGLASRRLSRCELDITEPLQVSEILKRCRPWAIVNCAGYVNVDAAQSDVQRCFLSNQRGPENLAVICEDHGVKLLTFSSDLVFDGAIDCPYHERDVPSPLNVYGASKHGAEQAVLQLNPRALIVRTSAFFGPWDRANFVADVLHHQAHGRRMKVADDTSITPTYVPDLVHAALDLVLDDECGIWHLTNDGVMTWADFAASALDAFNLPSRFLIRCEMRELTLPAKRPLNSALVSHRGSGLMPTVEHALHRLVETHSLANPV